MGEIIRMLGLLSCQHSNEHATDITEIIEALTKHLDNNAG
jgi:hypothetical protein